MRGFDFYLVPGDLAYINNQPYVITEVTKDDIYIENPDGTISRLYIKVDPNKFKRVGDMISAYGRSYPITRIVDDEIYFQGDDGKTDVIYIDRDRLQVEGLDKYHTVRLEKYNFDHKSLLESPLDNDSLLETLRRADYVGVYALSEASDHTIFDSEYFWKLLIRDHFGDEVLKIQVPSYREMYHLLMEAEMNQYSSNYVISPYGGLLNYLSNSLSNFQKQSWFLNIVKEFDDVLLQYLLDQGITPKRGILAKLLDRIDILEWLSDKVDIETELLYWATRRLRVLDVTPDHFRYDINSLNFVKWFMNKYGYTLEELRQARSYARGLTLRMNRH